MPKTPNKKQRISFFIPFGVVIVSLLYTWTKFLANTFIPNFAHYLGLIFFALIIFMLFKDRSFKKALIALGIYLLLCTINLLSFLPFILKNSVGFSVASFNIWSPKLNGIALAVFALYAVLNFDTLSDIYLDYKETKGKL